MYNYRAIVQRAFRARSNFILRSLPDYILAIAFVSHHVYYLNRNFVVVNTSVQRTYIIENKLTENDRVKRESMNT